MCISQHKGIITSNSSTSNRNNSSKSKKRKITILTMPNAVSWITVAVGVLCAASTAALALDLSKLYGHMAMMPRQKRAGESPTLYRNSNGRIVNY